MGLVGPSLVGIIRPLINDRMLQAKLCLANQAARDLLRGKASPLIPHVSDIGLTLAPLHVLF